MKRALMFLLVLAMIFTAAYAEAAWTVTSKGKGEAGHYRIWEVVLTSDAAAHAITSLEIPRKIRGTSLMIMSVVPGAGGVAPDNTIDITLTNEFGLVVWVDTGISYTANTHHSLAADYKQYPTVFSDLKLTVNDIGAAGDQVTLYFFCWEE